MPIYDYTCDRCHRLVERKEPADAQPPTCVCGARMRRLLSVGLTARLRGKGFYSTDSSGKNEVYK